MATEYKNSFKELGEEQNEQLPNETKEVVIETVNSVHEIMEIIGLGITLPTLTMVNTLLFFIGGND